MIILHSETRVRHQTVLHGRSDTEPVQVYVLANDKKWYLQKNVQTHGRKRFSVTCSFGDQTSKSGETFQVVAIATADRPRTPIDTLPDVEKSNTITVTLR
jgi:hypothetical protein